MSSLYLPPVKPPAAALSASQNLIEHFGLTELYNKLCKPSSGQAVQTSSPLPPTFKCYIEHLPGNLDDLVAKSTAADEDDDFGSMQLQQLLNPAFRAHGFAKNMAPFTEEQLAASFSLQDDDRPFKRHRHEGDGAVTPGGGPPTKKQKKEKKDKKDKKDKKEKKHKKHASVSGGNTPASVFTPGGSSTPSSATHTPASQSGTPMHTFSVL